MPEKTRLSKKVVLLGDPSVGKTSVARKFVFDIFEDKYITTLGTKISKKEMVYDIPVLDMRIKLTLLVWDVMGQHDFSKFHEVAFTGCMGGIIVSDITREDTIENWEFWKESLFKSAGEIPIVIIGNKYDLKANHKSGVEQFKKISEDFEIPSYYTSAKTGENIEEAFHLLGEFILRKDYKI